ncbi:cytochrome c biogenesis CcdA family protein [Actinoplanes sp. NPDC051494]|uniref:cytochrome c biogenesis CcdA family protein n=1 Tax=Actinoplanes sp. NPDC051494 TaxID=3363907 RepID=UPI00379833F1
MLGAVNPCGFAVLPAYLSILVVGEQGGSVRRALRCSLALTLGYVLVFGAFGLFLTPLMGVLLPRLPWLTVVFGLLLAVVGVLLLTGRSLPGLGAAMRAPRLTGTTASMVLFGTAYAIASLGCAIGPFLALVASSLRAGSIGSGVALFVSYAAGMGLVIGVTALAVALMRLSALAWLRRATAFVPRIGGAVLLATGAYVAYYGWYELRLVKDLRSSGQDPVVDLAATVQRALSGFVGRLGAGGLLLLLAVLVPAAILLSRRRMTVRG